MSAYSTLILAANPQAYYRMDEASGNVAHDSSGNSYNATVSGATLGQTGAIAGDSNTSMLFTASGGLTLPYNLNPARWTALTLEFWINLGTGWNHVVVAVDATSTDLYLNGISTSAGSISGASVLIDTILDFAGSLTTGGNLDEVALYNYKFSSGLAAAHYFASRTPQFGTFNLNDNTNYILRSKNLDFAEVKPMLQKLAHLDGMKISGLSVNSRQIQVVLEVIGSSRVDLENRLDTLDLALSLKQQQLTLHTTPENRYFVADCLSAKTQFLNADGPVKAMVTLVFLCQIPYAINPTVSTQSIAAGNLTLVSGHVYQFANQVFSGGGTAIALPTIHLVNTNGVAWTQVQITEVTDNRTLTITSNLPSSTNDYLDIYCDPNAIPSGGYSIMKNGSTPCAFKGVFPVLQPMMTSWNIQVTTGGSTPAGSAQWSWNARYAR